MKKIGIYKITSPTNNIYIGQSVNIEKRIKAYKLLDCKKQIGIYRSLIKHGVENHIFEIVCECDLHELNTKERYYQDLYNVIGSNGLNCRLTGENDRSGYFSKESRDKMSIAMKGIIPSAESRKKMRDAKLGKKLSKEHKLKISISNKGKCLGRKSSEDTKKKISYAAKNISDETRLKMSISASTRIVTDETRKKLSAVNSGKNHPMYNKHHSESAKNKISIANKGSLRTHETKLKMSKSKKGIPPNNCRLVLDMLTGVFYYSSKEVSNLYGCGKSTLINKLNNVRYNNTQFIYV